MPFEEGTKTDLWGNEIKLPSKEDRWREVEVALNELYQIYYSREHQDQTPAAVETLMQRYDDWLD
jgi:hypothetical protein